MALYRIGTAAMDAQGVITGTGTKWREPLSLIRTGATIVFLEQPVIQLAVISEIVSDTEMKAISTDGAVVSDGKYVILLNDSLTVDGMAQDVAETLRYYQSKETVIEEALDFFRNFDLKELQDLINKVHADAAQVAADKVATEQLKNDTQQIKDSAVNETQQIKDAAVNETQQIKDSAIAETNQIKADTDAIKNQTQQIKDSAVTEITGIKNEALDARDEAENAQLAAEQSKVGADNAKSGAETARDEARQWAQQVNPDNMLHKDQNLNDIANIEEARANLKVPSISEAFLKKDNLDGIADRAAAWLNVRPIGPTPLAGDPVNDYDATTVRWVENRINSGILGPTMNGVMNYGVGDFHLRDSRAYIQPYEITSDGQLLSREDYPELWSYAQLLSPISDSDWLADVEKRGRYSTGDGTTTFRVPDRNGVQPGSVTSLFGRGDGGTSSEDGRIYQAAAPNIIGTFANDTSGKVWMPSPRTVSGAFGYASSTEETFLPNDGTFGRIRNNATTNFNAERSDSVYGRYAISNNIIPKNFVGVWVIRAFGGFIAANTSWSVINGDKELPQQGTFVTGGKIQSKYKVGTADNFSADFYASQTIGNGITEAKISAVGDNTSVMIFGSDGNLTIPGNALSRAFYGTGGSDVAAVQKLADQQTNDSYKINQLSYLANSNCGVTNYIITAVDGITYYSWQLTKSNGSSLSYSIRDDGIMNTPLGVVAIQGSDVRIKDRFEKPKVGAWDRVKQIGVMEFSYKGNNVLQRGYLAQQMAEIDDTYVFFGGTATDENGDEFEIMNVNDRAVVSDLIVVIQELQKDNEEMKEEITEMKTAMAEMKAMLVQLTK
ncbi:tail fiber protein [Escherichia phage LL5]|uniref:Tail fiber protein n=1 Tax=Escherichia phage LL5 TaxID=2233992 RepID=A0A2Z4Q3B6_9CAUD|nr:tail fiber protein [Escherichia phage LL5]AWY04359.1 tail fiber protein [Escherichia phage LL5]